MFNLEEQGLLEQDFSKTLWGAELLKDLEEETKNDITILEDVAETLQNDRDLEPFYKIIDSDINQINTLEIKTIYVVMVKMNIKSDISIFNTFLNYKQFTHLLHFPHHSRHINSYYSIYYILYCFTNSLWRLYIL